MAGEFEWYVGIDWAMDAHELCVIDAAGAVIDKGSATHSGDGLAELADRLLRLCSSEPERVAVAIEVPHGAVVETLLERGFAVFSLNPKQLDRFRDRYSPAGAKDDRLDAYVLADSARTDLHCFRRLHVPPAEMIRLRELVRTEEELKRDLRRTANRLRELLHRYYPQMLALSPAADEPWFWDLVARAPVPDKGRRLRESTLQKLLRKHRIRRLSPGDIRTALQLESLRLAPGSVAAASDHVAVLIPRLQLTHRQLNQVQHSIGALLEQLSGQPDAEADPADPEPECREHRDVEILLSSPGIGRIVAATMLAQAHWAISHRDYHAFRAQAGLAPITRSSGRSRRVMMRRACDNRLRNACYHMARVASMHDPAARAQYSELRSRGHSHGRALRGVADRLLRIICAMLRDGTLYDPTRFAPELTVAA